MKEALSPAIEQKKKIVSELAEKLKNSKTLLLASTKSLPSSQFHKIKKSLRGKAELRVVKKTILNRAILATEKGSLQNLKDYIKSDVAVLISEEDAFELSSILSENQSPVKAKSGDIAPEDIRVEQGPTDLPPGPAISELSGVGLKVSVEGGKLAIKQGATLVKEGEKINEKVASVLAKLNITPMKVGFIPIAAYDSVSETIYTEIKIDKPAALEELRVSISKSLGFAVKIIYTTDKTIPYLIAKAGLQEKALQAHIHDNNHKEEAQ